jgi:hypothetical protein
LKCLCPDIKTPVVKFRIITDLYHEEVKDARISLLKGEKRIAVAVAEDSEVFFSKDAIDEKNSMRFFY